MEGLGPEMERAVFLRGLTRLQAQGMGSSDLSLLLFSTQKLLGVLSDSHSDIAISVLMRNIVNVGHVAPEINLKTLTTGESKVKKKTQHEYL